MNYLMIFGVEEENLYIIRKIVDMLRENTKTNNLYFTLNGKDAQIRLADLRIDSVKRRLYVKDREAVLSSKDFDILLLFVNNPGKVFKSDGIYDRIWHDHSAENVNNTISHHISTIRKSIAHSGAKIFTVRGCGYRLLEES